MPRKKKKEKQKNYFFLARHELQMRFLLPLSPQAKSSCGFVLVELLSVRKIKLND